jgi:hypothetical protein
VGISFPHVDFSLWLLLAAFVLTELLALGFFLYLKRHNYRGKEQRPNPEQSGAHTPASLVREEMERLRGGGSLTDSVLRGFSEDERLLFEVAAIDALSRWPAEDRERMRAMLIKLGYHEQCARRSLRGGISDRIRASTLLDLLRPDTDPEPRPHETPQDIPPDTHKRARAAKGCGGTKAGPEH